MPPLVAELFPVVLMIQYAVWRILSYWYGSPWGALHMLWVGYYGVLSSAVPRWR
jgi:hypothetical protein